MQPGGLSLFPDERQGPGRGGTQRGPGTAPLWGRETPELAAEMRNEALPAPVEMDAETMLQGLSLRAPEVNPDRETLSESAAVEGVHGAAAWKRRLRPSHRRAVRGFFDPDGTSGSAPPPSKED